MAQKKARWNKLNLHQSWRSSAHLKADPAQILKGSVSLKENLQINPSDSAKLGPRSLEIYKYNPGDF